MQRKHQYGTYRNKQRQRRNVRQAVGDDNCPDDVTRHKKIHTHQSGLSKIVTKLREDCVALTIYLRAYDSNQRRGQLLASAGTANSTGGQVDKVLADLVMAERVSKQTDLLVLTIFLWQLFREYTQ